VNISQALFNFVLMNLCHSCTSSMEPEKGRHSAQVFVIAGDFSLKGCVCCDCPQFIHEETGAKVKQRSQGPGLSLWTQHPQPFTLFIPSISPALMESILGGEWASLVEELCLL
jgi:hypothetical protein